MALLNVPSWLNTIKTCIFTDVLNWKTSEKSYEDLCKRFAKSATLMSIHQKLFVEFTKEICDLPETQTNINEMISNESMYFRYRILHDVISKVPINKSYKELCEMIGNVDYPEFEFCYYRFSNGQRDLDYDRSKDPTPLTFSDLPIDVIEKVIEVSEVKPRYILRGVSRGLRRIIDSSKLVIQNIEVVVVRSYISIVVDDFKIIFSWQASPWIKCTFAPVEYFTDNACRLLSTFIGNPKLQLESLTIDFRDNSKESKQVAEILKSIPHQLHVRCLKVFVNEYDEDLVNFIHCVKPRILKRLEVKCYFIKLKLVYGMIESEQWKNIEEAFVPYDVTLGIAHFFHLKHFEIRSSVISVESMIELRDGTSKSLNFEWCLIRFLDGPSDEQMQNGLDLKIRVYNDIEYFVYTIPNSTDTLMFYFSESYEDRVIFIKKLFTPLPSF